MLESAMDPVAKDVNFIWIGQPVKSLGETLAEDILGKIEVESKGNEENVNMVHQYSIKKVKQLHIYERISGENSQMAEQIKKELKGLGKKLC